MSNKALIHSSQAPEAIGPYSQAIKANQTVYFSGQIPLDPNSMELVEGDITIQSRRVFENLKAVAEQAGGSLAQMVKITIYLTDLSSFAEVNAVMAEYFQQPYPARACVGVASLPKGAAIEIDGIMVL